MSVISVISVIPLLIVCLIIIALIIYAVYSSIYKKKINKRLESYESTAHVSMASTESFGKGILTIGAIVVSIVTIYMHSNTSTKIDDMKKKLNQVYRSIDSLRYEISELQDQLNEQESAFLTFECELGEVDNVNHTVEVLFKCVPKMSGNDTLISVTIEKNTITLEKNNNGTYTGKMDLPLFNYINKIYASITTNGITTSSTVYADFYSLPYVDCLPELGVDLEQEKFEFKNNKFYIIGVYWSKNQEVKDDSNVNETKIGIKDEKLIFKINGKIEKEILITKQFNSISEEFSAKSGDKVEIISQGTDNYGYIHQRLLLSTEKNDSWSESYSDSIFDSNGKLLYSEEGIYTK
ncbi:MAG: hypothetical protein J6V36_01230 [Clostridia bacterium]|nr:hypothetical protein [Clostridia bacterium]